jgi:aspartate-semialdehyde dehydrogenase
MKPLGGFVDDFSRYYYFQEVQMKIGIIGATGLIGRTLLKVLRDSSFPIEVVYLTASDQSTGKEIVFQDKSYPIEITSINTLQKACDVVIVASSAEVSSQWTPGVTAYAPWIIDISSCHRNDPTIPLVVPEINRHILDDYTGIISNPNCSTIQLVKPLYPIQRLFGLEKVIVSTYQSISGMGQNGINAFHEEKDKPIEQAPLSKNCTPYIGLIEKDGYCQEEQKMIHETRRILSEDSLQICPTSVRVPIEITHGESVYVETKEPIEQNQLLQAYEKLPFITYDDTSLLAMNAIDTNQVYIGRFRFCDKKAVQFWSVADNLLVGSVWNAYQILTLLERRLK